MMTSYEMIAELECVMYWEFLEILVFPLYSDCDLKNLS